MKFEVSKKPIAAFSFSSLTDIVLLLLIFFLLTSQFVINNGVQVHLPKTENETKSSSSPLTVSITKNGDIYFMGKKSSLTELSRLLESKRSSKPDENLLIQADKEVNLDFVIKVIDIAKGLGINKFTIQTEKE